MNNWRTFMLSLAALFTFAVSVAGQPDNLTGEWAVTLKTPKGDLIVKATIKQDGEKLSGMVKGPMGVRSEPVQGTIHGPELKVISSLTESGNTIPVTLTGRVEGDTMKGKADFGGYYEGDWNAKRLAGATASETNNAAVSASPPGERADVTGTWAFEVETNAGASSPTFIFKQEGEMLTGQYIGAFGESPLTGAVKGKEIKFSFKLGTQGSEVTVSYAGIVEKNSMKGDLSPRAHFANSARSVRNSVFGKKRILMFSNSGSVSSQARV